jgi:hypothetical protein
MTDVERARSSIVDGWGIHVVPFRGTTYNLWGFDCVKLTVGRRTIRVGSDDAARLADFLTRRLAAEPNDSTRGAASS